METEPSLHRLWNSVVADVSDFTWNDSGWMAERKKYDDRRQPVSIYETSLGQWKIRKRAGGFCERKGIYSCGTSSGYGISGG